MGRTRREGHPDGWLGLGKEMDSSFEFSQEAGREYPKKPGVPCMWTVR